MSTIYDTLTINNPTGGVSSSYSGTQISVNVPFVATVAKAEVELNPKQSGTGDPSPTNVIPITGTAAVTLYKRAAQGSSFDNYYNKSFGTTVYSGSFDYISGKLTADYATVVLNSTNQTWALNSNGSSSRNFRAQITGIKSMHQTYHDSSKCFCTHAKWSSSFSSLAFGSFYYSYSYVCFPDYNQRFSSVDEFTAWLDEQEAAGTPVTILYPLATATITTLSKTTISTLAGQNYFDTSSNASYRLPLTMTIRQTMYTIPRPPEFAPQREDIYAGMYTTCNGETRADKIGWKYADMTLSWDALYQDDVEKLFSLNGNEIYLVFDDPSGASITEQIIRTSVVSMRHRFTENNKHWWKDVSIDISFLGTHTD